MTKVLIGGPIRDRDWVVQDHLNHLKNMIIPDGVETDFLYILNDSIDRTEDILKENQIPYLVHNTHSDSGSVRGRYQFENLAILRNFFLEEFLRTDATHLLSIDSDILVPDFALRELLDDDLDIVSMLISNQSLSIEQKRAHNVMYADAGGIMQHIYDFPMDQIFPVDLTGACYLIKREVIEAGCTYRYNVQGEDIPFCKDAKAKGFSIYCDSRIRPIHMMSPAHAILGGRIIS